MAFFKFRWPGQKEEAEQPSSRRSSRKAQGDSVESLRRRARHRLIGAAVLGALADWIGIIQVFGLCAFLPFLGFLTIFLPRHKELHEVSA